MTRSSLPRNGEPNRGADDLTAPIGFLKVTNSFARATIERNALQRRHNPQSLLVAAVLLRRAQLKPRPTREAGSQMRQKEISVRRSSAIVFALALIAAVGIGTPVLADSVVIGGSNSSDVTPFGWDDGDTPQLAFQQLYGASSFGSDPILITQLTFFFDPSSSWQGDMFYVNQQLSLSTSAESHTSPGTSFAANRGADFTQVFSGTFSVGFAGGFPANPCSD